jgi:hypothetical protein
MGSAHRARIAQRAAIRSMWMASVISVWAVGCNQETEEPFDEPIEMRPDSPPIAGFPECIVVRVRERVESAEHVTTCSPLEYDVHPPIGGPHYTTWADFGIYDRPVPWPFLVHSLEHGAVILAYNCPDGCPDVVALFEQLAAERTDPRCRRYGTLNRVIVVPDPELATPIAAVGWEHRYSATCLDEPSLRAFVDGRYARGREDTCLPGERRERWCP